MSKKKSDLVRRRISRTRRGITGKSVATVVDRPEWLPEDWTMEIKTRGKSSTNRKRVDRYYICPFSGKRLRSRLEVMRVLDNKILEHSAPASASHDGGYKKLPTVELRSSEVKRTIARKEPIPDAITEIKLADSPQEPASSSFSHASTQLDNDASETSRSTPQNVEHLDQRISESQIEREPNPTIHIEEQPAINVLPVPGNEKLSEPLVHPVGEIPVPDADLSEEPPPFEPTKKRSQPQRHKRHGSINTEAVGSVNNRHSVSKKSTEKRESIPTRTSKRLAGVTAEPSSDFGTGKKLKFPKTTQIERARPIVPEAHEKDAFVTVEEETKCLNSSEEASKEQPADELQPIVPVDTDASCPSHPIDTPETNELKEKRELAEPSVAQASQEQHPNNPPTNTLPFGDSWSDPCIEFAFKTLTSDISVLEDFGAIQDYFDHQRISLQSPDLNIEPSSSAFGGPQPLQNGKTGLSNPTSKKTM